MALQQGQRPQAAVHLHELTSEASTTVRTRGSRCALWRAPRPGFGCSCGHGELGQRVVEAVIRPLEMAIWRRRPPAGPTWAGRGGAGALKGLEGKSALRSRTGSLLPLY